MLCGDLNGKEIQKRGLICIHTVGSLCCAQRCEANYEGSVKVSVSRVRPFVTPWTVAHQAPLSMRFSRQEYWSGLPFLSPGDLPNPGNNTPIKINLKK